MKRDRPVKPLPWRCPNCGERAVEPATVEHVARIRYEGRAYTVRVPQLECTRCGACGETFFSVRSDEQIATALREQLGLLQPEQIREQRKRLGLTQKQLAEALGIAPETVSRWESGLMIQSRAMDRSLRVFFRFPQVRQWLRDRVTQGSPVIFRILERVARQREAEASNRVAMWAYFSSAVGEEEANKWWFGLRRVCDRYHVRRLSAVRWIQGDEGEPQRGIGLLADFEPQRKPGFFGLIEMTDRLRELFGPDIQLRTPQELSPELRERVEGEAELVHERE